MFETKDAVRNRQGLGDAATWSFRQEGLGHRGEATKAENGGARVFAERLRLHFTPKFRLWPGMRVFAAGSCFAREIERALFAAGVAVTSCTPGCGVPEEQFHRYNSFSIVNDFDYAAGRDYDTRNVLAMPDGRFADLTAYVAAGSVEAVVEARRRMIDIHRRALEADVIVLTLGLVEAWFDTLTQTYLNLAPFAFFRREPERFQLHVTGFAENRQVLRRFLRRLHAANPAGKVILTVSPVPFTDSFSGQDVVVANCYSKSVLRAVAQEVADGLEHVDYFPSYELVTLSDHSAAWLADHRHVPQAHVAHIIQSFLECYGAVA